MFTAQCDGCVPICVPDVIDGETYADRVTQPEEFGFTLTVMEGSLAMQVAWKERAHLGAEHCTHAPSSFCLHTMQRRRNRSGSTSSRL